MHQRAENGVDLSPFQDTIRIPDKLVYNLNPGPLRASSPSIPECHSLTPAVEKKVLFTLQRSSEILLLQKRYL